MIRVTVEIKERTTSRRVSVTAPSIERALRMSGEGLPGRDVRVVFPIAPEEFFVRDEAQSVAESVAERVASAPRAA